MLPRLGSRLTASVPYVLLLETAKTNCLIALQNDVAVSGL